MNQLNSVIIEGNIVKKAELKQPKEGFKVCTFSVGVNRWYKKANGDGESEVSYFEVETFGRMAEICAEKGDKGREIRVVGRLKQDRWSDSNDKTKSRIFVVAEHIEFKPKAVVSTGSTNGGVVSTGSTNGGVVSTGSTNGNSSSPVEPVETSDDVKQNSAPIESVETSAVSEEKEVVNF